MPKLTTVLAVLFALATPAFAQDAKWDFDDPEIAAATFGMLSPMLKKNFCGKLRVNEAIFVRKLRLQEFLPQDIQNRCRECFQTGLEGANTLLRQKGRKGYCNAMIKLFGVNGTTFKGLVE